MVTATALADLQTAAVSEKVVRAIPDGLRRLEKGTPAPPSYFDQRALRAARELASSPKERKLTYLQFHAAGAPVRLARNFC